MKLGVFLLLLLDFLQHVFAQLPITAFTERSLVEEGQGSGLLEVEQEDELADTYWSGTAPICFGGCKGRHMELKRDNCGDSDCCWVGYKSLCRVNCGKPDVDFNGIVYGSDWWVGSVVRYDCRPGFVLVGDPARACQSNGKWTPKPSCLRVCHRGRVEINEKDIDGTCSSTCPDAKSYAVPLNHKCSRIENCRTKESGWKRWFTRCNYCDCDCFTPCSLQERR
ncbi:zona pellucida sperm-binding protein 3 receptor isoform X2 [Danio rerio]